MIDFNEYKTIKTLGEGTFGTAYLLENKKNPQERIVAKLIDKSINKKSLINEIEAMKKISNDRCMNHLICLDDFSETPFGFIITSNYVEGIELFEYITQSINKKKIEFEEIRYIMHQLLNILDYIHNTLNMAHVDIKPENIMINPDTKFVTLIDFGLACIKEKCDVKGYTPGYGSPHILNIYNDKRKVLLLEEAKQSDIFSMGIVFFELLYCGVNPFKNIEIDNLSSDEIMKILFKSIEKEQTCDMSSVKPEKLKVLQNIIKEMISFSNKKTDLNELSKNEIFSNLKFTKEYILDTFKNKEK